MIKKAFQYPERLWWEMIPIFKSGRPHPGVNEVL